MHRSLNERNGKRGGERRILRASAYVAHVPTRAVHQRNLTHGLPPQVHLSFDLLSWGVLKLSSLYPPRLSIDAFCRRNLQGARMLNCAPLVLLGVNGCCCICALWWGVVGLACGHLIDGVAPLQRPHISLQRIAAQSAATHWVTSLESWLRWQWPEVVDREHLFGLTRDLTDRLASFQVEGFAAITQHALVSQI
eukprot:2970300-Rhodomonas_salina.1